MATKEQNFELGTRAETNASAREVCETLVLVKTMWPSSHEVFAIMEAIEFNWSISILFIIVGLHE